MKSSWYRTVWTAGIVLALVAGIGASGCSKKKTTNPTVNLELNSTDLGLHATYDHPFANAGTYAYHCKHHGSMTASVTVAAGSPASASVTISGNTFTPNSVSVMPGGPVHWVNNDAATHTVTSD